MSNHSRTVPAWRLAFLFVITLIAITLGAARARAQE